MTTTIDQTQYSENFASTTALEPINEQGLAAFSLALSELKPVDDSQELWLKYGHDRFIVADTFDPTGSCWETKGNGTERVRTIQHPNRYEFLVSKEKEHGGGVFLLHSQPQGHPLKERIRVSNNICVELDDGTPEEQWDKLSEFVHLSGLKPQKILTSGGKSYHAHWQGTEHFPIEQTVYLRRLTAIALMSDPAACNPHQPMRVEGFDRHEDGTLKGHQTRVYQSGNCYTDDEIVAGLKRYFVAKGLPFPDAITDEWWTVLKRLIKANDLDRLKAELFKGLAGYEAEKRAKAEKAEKALQERLKRWGNQPVTDGLGKTVSECVEEAKHRLGTSLYEKYGYKAGDRRFCCPFHHSQSKNSAWVSPASDGTPLFHCPTCTGEKGVNSFQFFLMESKRSFGIPKGEEYVEFARDYCQLAGIESPVFKPQKVKDGNKKNGDRNNEERLPQNEWLALAEHNYQMGIWQDKPDADGNKQKVFIPQSNFVFSIERILQSTATGGGYILRIERNIDGRLTIDRLEIDSNDCIKANDLARALNEGLGVHLICVAKHQDLLRTFQVKTEDYYKKGGTVYRSASRHGCQSDGAWVFENGQIDSQGNLTNETQTKWVFNSRLSTGDEHIPSPRLAERNPDALKNLVNALREFSCENFPLFLAMLGYGAMTTQFQTIIKVEGAFPVVNAYGDPGGMKSVAAESAASIFGSNWATDGVVSHLSESALYERLKSTGNLLTVYDDPKRDAKSTNIDELLKRLYNAKPRVVRGNTQTPYSPVLVTTNHACGDDSAAARSRLIRLFFPVVDITEAAKLVYPKVKEAQRQASGALPDIIKLGYPKAEIDKLESELIIHLPGAHVRIAKSLAQLTYYTQAICNMADVDIDFKQWMIANLCPSENDADANKNSLEDFLDKVSILQGKSVLGEWNVKQLEKDGQTYMALCLNEVWAAVDKEFQPPYNLSIIKALITQSGGSLKYQQRFYPDSDVTKAYWRNKLLDSNAAEPKLKNKKCCLIPFPSCNQSATSCNQSATNLVAGLNQYAASDSELFSPLATNATNNLFVKKENLIETPPQQAVIFSSEDDPSKMVASVASVAETLNPIQNEGSSCNQNGCKVGCKVVASVADADSSITNDESAISSSENQTQWKPLDKNGREVKVGDRVMYNNGLRERSGQVQSLRPDTQNPIKVVANVLFEKTIHTVFLDCCLKIGETG